MTEIEYSIVRNFVADSGNIPSGMVGEPEINRIN
jgi:hypothetical protein